MRLEVERKIDDHALAMLVRELGASQSEVYHLPRPLDLRGLEAAADLDRSPCTTQGQPVAASETGSDPLATASGQMTETTPRQDGSSAGVICGSGFGGVVAISTSRIDPHLPRAGNAHAARPHPAVCSTVVDVAQHVAGDVSRAGVGLGEPLPDLVIDLGDLAQLKVVHPHVGARMGDFLESVGPDLVWQGDREHGGHVTGDVLPRTPQVSEAPGREQVDPARE